jgi:hypothetical protein
MGNNKQKKSGKYSKKKKLTDCNIIASKQKVPASSNHRDSETKKNA